MKVTELEVDPTGLLPGDIVVRLSEHEISGCHCDVRVLVRRPAGHVSPEGFDPGTGRSAQDDWGKD